MVYNISRHDHTTPGSRDKERDLQCGLIGQVQCRLMQVLCTGNPKTEWVCYP